MGARHSFRYKFILGLAIAAVGVFATSGLWLPLIGAGLVYDEPPVKGDAAVVLAGDYWGNRLIRGAELVRQGYVPVVLVSGPPGIYGTSESELAVRWAVKRGYPAQWFVQVPHTAPSTKEEAFVMLKALEQRNAHSFLLVTSNFHSARARRIFLKAEQLRGGGPPFHTVASIDPFYSANGWWHLREGRKIAFFEWVKTLTGALGI